jgi:sulfate adenylyltransferase
LDFRTNARDINIRRIGFLASEISKDSGLAICPSIAPFEMVRKEVHSLVEGGGGFVLVYVATPLEVCEQREHKGLYAKARARIVKQFTGISDPYYVPSDADVIIPTVPVGWWSQAFRPG